MSNAKKPQLAPTVKKPDDLPASPAPPSTKNNCSYVEVFAPGATVNLHEDKTNKTSVKGKVLQVCLRANRCVQYQVSWWDGNSRSTAWVEQCEVSHSKSSEHRVRLGFGGQPLAETG